MKKAVLLPAVAALLTATSAYAQPQKGTYIVGASLAGANGYINSTHSNYGQVIINPRVGYFITDRLALGTSLSLAGAFGSGYTSLHTGLSPFARYYFFPKDGARQKKLYFFGEGNIGAGVNTSHVKWPGADGITIPYLPVA